MSILYVLQMVGEWPASSIPKLKFILGESSVTLASGLQIHYGSWMSH